MGWAFLENGRVVTFETRAHPFPGDRERIPDTLGNLIPMLFASRYPKVERRQWILGIRSTPCGMFE